MKKLLLLIILIGVYSQLSSATDSINQISLIQARTAFDQKKYDDAIKKYEDILESDVLSVDERNDVVYRLGVSYEKTGESRDAAYFYGEFVRMNRVDHPNFKEALYKAGQMNFKNANGSKGQSFSRSVILYFTHYLELYSDDPKISSIEKSIIMAENYIAEYHYSQFGRYYFRHGNYCGAFIAFDDSLEASEKYLEDIIRYAQNCQKRKSCRTRMKSCFEEFSLDHISSLEVIRPQ